jgi:diguanylate cyclase (GGDEF)-like protein
MANRERGARHDSPPEDGGDERGAGPESATDAARSLLADKALAEPLRALVGGLVARVDLLTGELAAARSRAAAFEKLAVEDPLVPALNRRGFMRELGRAISYVARHSTPAALIFIDLDDFKSVNDSFGHAAGDHALRQYGALLRACIRSSDTIGRIGGDEFAIILWNASEEDAVRKARTLAGMIESRILSYGGHETRVRASAGATPILATDTPESVLSRADRAMYAAKAENRLRL